MLSSLQLFTLSPAGVSVEAHTWSTHLSDPESIFCLQLREYLSVAFFFCFICLISKSCCPKATVQNHSSPDPESYCRWSSIKEGPLSLLCCWQGNPYVGLPALLCMEMVFVCPSKTEACMMLCFVTSDFSHFHSRSPKALGCRAMLACAGRVVALEVQSALLWDDTHVFI